MKCRAREGGDRFSAQLGTSSTGRLRFANGLHGATIRADANLTGLYTAHFGDQIPTVGVRGGEVSVRYAGRRAFDLLGCGTEHPAEVVLNPSLPWDVEIRGSASKLLADLRGVRLGSFHLTGGAGRVEVVLPVPSGTATVVVRGGASNVVVRCPAGVPTHLCVSGGATNLWFVNRHIRGAGGDLDFWSHNPAGARNRCGILVTGGANNLTVDEKTQAV
jgi:hypothetical protein